MNIGWIGRAGMCLFVFTISLLSYISKQNEVTRLKIHIPKIEKQLNALNEEIRQLQYEIDRFENPARLMDLACHPDFSHLKHPFIKDIETIPEGFALKMLLKEDISTRIMAPLPIGSKNK